MRRRTAIAITVSATWLGLAAALAFSKRGTWDDLALNAWGDFFAGAMAPLALFWLVIGYFQQGEELEQNTNALRAQERELAAQVAATTALANHAERQAHIAEEELLAARVDREAARTKEVASARPVFLASGPANGTGAHYAIPVKNFGGAVTEVAIECEPPTQMSIKPNSIFEATSIGKIRVIGERPYPFRFLISYRDRNGHRTVQYYRMTAMGKFHELTEATVVDPTSAT